ncbi:MAG: UDP-N-acetylmuramate dehydrogenase [Bacteroidaceae bacterium]|nr:UDP-N-acetylmuramate dehydrogenase [Bacteroidaceae bacterium]
MLTIKTDYSLKAHNSFGLDVKAKYFVEYESAEDLAGFLSGRDTGDSRVFHIGSGSDILFTGDFDGYVLHSAVKGIHILEQHNDHVVLSVGAAEDWDNFVAWTIAHGYYGLENLSLIPSEVGAAAVQNIGAYGAEAKDFITSVDCVDMRDGTTVCHLNHQCGFGYRKSNYKESWRGQYAILRVTFTLPTAFHPNISYKGLNDLPTDGLTAETVRSRVIQLRRSKLPEPSETGNAGSFFLNPIITAEHYANLLQAYPDIPHYPARDAIDTEQGHVKVPAAWLIEQAGWKGKSQGRAGVYKNQPLVLVNLGGATPGDIVNLASAIVKDVQRMFGITLIPEVIYL